MRNMTKKIVFGVAVVAFATFVMTPSASANCAGPKTVNTYSSSGTSYWHLPSGDLPGVLVSQAWQLGAPATFNSAGGGTTPACNAMAYFSGPSINIGGDLSTCGTGCPSSGATLAVLVTHTQPNGASSLLVATVVETPTGSTSNFDFGGQGDKNLVRLPAPTVSNSGPRSGNLMPLTVQIPQFLTDGNGLSGPGASSAITGYKVVAALSATEPSRDAALFNAPVTGGTIAAPGGGPVPNTAVQLDCGAAPGVDGWVALQVTFENGAILQSSVSKPTRVRCQGAMADPKFKPVKKKPAVLGRDQ